ncbi:MAG: hypothetical protein K6F68_00175 [Clostridiales bacterium]|nr:hypothetical protein [Clostridiales bacterium]
MENKVRKVTNAIAAVLNELPKEVPSAPTSPNYPLFLKENLPKPSYLKKQRSADNENGPLFSIVIVCNNTADVLFPTVISLLAQTYANWELIISSETSGDDFLAGIDKRIRIIESGDPLKAAEKEIRGDLVIRLLPRDRLEPDALYLFAETIGNDPSVSTIYADHDVQDEYGRRSSPVFKPSFSPVTEIAFDYIKRPLVVKTSIHMAAGGFMGSGADFSHAYILRCIKKARLVKNIPRILLSASEDSDSEPGSVFSFGKTLYAYEGSFKGSFRINSLKDKKSSVTLVIGDASDAAALKRALESVDTISTCFDYKIIICVGSSIDGSLNKYLEALGRNKAAKIVHEKIEVSVPALLNRGAAASFSEYIVFLSSYAEVISPSFIEELILPLKLKNVAVTGGKLLSPDGTLYNTGTVIGLGGPLGSPFSGTADDMEDKKKCFYTSVQRNVSAVSGCMMAVSAEGFMKIGMFDENLTDHGWDTEFCIRAIKAGKQVVYTPFAEAKLTRLPDYPDDKSTFLEGYEKDPFFSPNYDLRFTDPQLAISPDH